MISNVSVIISVYCEFHFRQVHDLHFNFIFWFLFYYKYFHTKNRGVLTILRAKFQTLTFFHWVCIELLFVKFTDFASIKNKLKTAHEKSSVLQFCSFEKKLLFTHFHSKILISIVNWTALTQLKISQPHSEIE